MTTPFSAEDLRAVFEPRTLTRARTLVLLGAVEVALSGPSITAAVADAGLRRTATLTPSARGNRVGFGTRCTCRQTACAHMAATGLAALDRFPELRRKMPPAGLGLQPGAKAPRTVVFELAAASPPHACTVTTLLLDEQTSRTEDVAPGTIAVDETRSADVRAVAGLLDAAAAKVAPEQLDAVVNALLQSGHARWGATRRRLLPGPPRSFEAGKPPALPPRSAVLLGTEGNWYVDAATGAVGQARFRAATAPAKPVRGRKREAIPLPALQSDSVIVERTAAPVLQLTKRYGPDEAGTVTLQDTLTLDFDYAGEKGGSGVAEGGTEQQFVRIAGKGGPEFVRRDPVAEAAAAQVLADYGFVQLRVAEGTAGKGRRVHVLRGEDAAEQWHRFLAQRMPELQEDGWRCTVDTGVRPARREIRRRVRCAGERRGAR